MKSIASLLWRKQIRLAVSPEKVGLVRMSRAMRPRPSAGAWLASAPADGQPPWAGAIQALPELLGDAKLRHARATVVLSDHLVRYLVVPWKKELSNANELVEYARARFEQLHGDGARDWQLRIGNAPQGAPRLVAAIDTALVGALRLALATFQITMVSCQPALTALVDGRRALVGEDAWIVNAERGRLVIARISGGQWRSVRSRPMAKDKLVLRDLIAQERLLVPGAGSECKVFLHATHEVDIDAADMPVQTLLPVNGRLPSQVRGNVALAMAGIPS